MELGPTSNGASLLCALYLLRKRVESAEHTKFYNGPYERRKMVKLVGTFFGAKGSSLNPRFQ